MNYEELLEKHKQFTDRIRSLREKDGTLLATKLADLKNIDGKMEGFTDILNSKQPYQIEKGIVEDLSFELKENGEWSFYLGYFKPDCDVEHLHQTKGTITIETIKELMEYEDNPEKQIEWSIEMYMDEEECEYCQEDEEYDW